MSNPVAQRILDEANAEAAKVAQAAAEEARSIEEQARAQAQADAKAILEGAEEDARRHAEGIVADARLAVRMAELTARRELMDQAIASALARMAEAPADEFRQVALRLVQEDHFEDGQELVTSPGDKDVWDPSFVATLNQALAGKASVTVVEDASVGRRAFVIRQGRKSVECSPASALRARREEIEEDIASFLFGGGA